MFSVLIIKKCISNLFIFALLKLSQVIQYIQLFVLSFPSGKIIVDTNFLNTY